MAVPQPAAHADRDIGGDQHVIGHNRGGLGRDGRVNAVQRNRHVAGQEDAGAAHARIRRGNAQRRADGAQDADDGLQLDRARPRAGEHPVIAGDHVGLGGNDDQIQVKLAQPRPQIGEFAVEADDHRDPQPVPLDDIDRLAGNGDAAGPLRLKRRQAQLVLAVARAVGRQQPCAVEIGGNAIHRFGLERNGSGQDRHLMFRGHQGNRIQRDLSGFEQPAHGLGCGHVRRCKAEPLRAGEFRKDQHMAAPRPRLRDPRLQTGQPGRQIRHHRFKIGGPQVD